MTQWLITEGKKKKTKKEARNTYKMTCWTKEHG